MVSSVTDILFPIHLIYVLQVGMCLPMMRLISFNQRFTANQNLQNCRTLPWPF